MQTYFSIREKNGGKNIFLRKTSKKYSSEYIEIFSKITFKVRNNSDIAKILLDDNSLSCLKRMSFLFEEPVIEFFTSSEEFKINYSFTPKGGYTSYNLVKMSELPKTLSLVIEVPYIKRTKKTKVEIKKESLSELMIKDKEISRINKINESLDKKIDYKKFDFIEEKSTKSSKGEWRTIGFTYKDFGDRVFTMDRQSFKEGLFKQEFLFLFKSKESIFQEEILPKMNKDGDLNIDNIVFIDLKLTVPSDKGGRMGISNIKFKCKYTNKNYVYSRTMLNSGQLSKTHKRDLSLHGSEASPIVKRLLLVAQSNGKDLRNIKIKELKLKGEKFHSIVFEKEGKLFIETITSFQENKNNEIEIRNSENSNEIKFLKKQIQIEKELKKEAYIKNKFLRRKAKFLEKVNNIFSQLKIDNNDYKIISVNLKDYKYSISFNLFNKKYSSSFNHLYKKLEKLVNKYEANKKTYFGIGVNPYTNEIAIKVGSTIRFEGAVLERANEIKNTYTFEFNEDTIISIEGNHESKVRDFLVNKVHNKKQNLFASIRKKPDEYTSLEFYHIDRLDDINEYLKKFGVRL